MISGFFTEIHRKEAVSRKSKERRPAEGITGSEPICSREAHMVSRSDRLPDQFPVGTRYVVEGQPAGEGRVRIRMHYLELPDGRHIDLPTHASSSRRRGTRAAATRK
jgi:hypothetical protein